MSKPNKPRASARDRAIDACDVLNDLVGDLVTGVMAFRQFHGEFQAGRLILQQMVSIQKMCISNIVLGLAKFEECWKTYHDLVPAERRDACKAILKWMQDRRLSDFRNKYVGHAIDRATKRPLKQSEVEAAFAVIADPNIEQFLRWINNHHQNVYPNTVVSVVETLRNTLQNAHGISPDEIIKR